MSRGESSTQNSRRFLARYGAIILRGGIASIPSALYRYQGELGLKPNQVWFISAVLAHKWDADMPKPSLKRMAPRLGVTEQYLHQIKGELVKAGWLTVINRHDARGGQATNYYDFGTLFGALEAVLKRDKPRPEDGAHDGEDDDDADDEEDDHHDDAGNVENSAGPLAGGLNHSLARGLNWDLAGGLNSRLALKESLEQESLEQESYKSSKGMRPSSLHKITKDPYSKQQFRKRTNSATIGFPDPPGTGTDVPATAGGFAAVGEVLARRQPLPAAPDKRTRAAGRGRPPKVSERVALLIEELTYKLHDDPANVRANITRAARLFKAAGLSDDAFYHRLHEAKSITQQQGGVQKPATDGYGLSHRMPYFFRVVKALLGLKDQSPDHP